MTFGTRKCPCEGSGACSSASVWPREGRVASSRGPSVRSPSGVKPPIAGSTALVSSSLNCSTYATIDATCGASVCSSSSVISRCASDAIFFMSASVIGMSLLRPVHAASGGEQEASAKVFVVYRAGRVVKLGGASKRPLLFDQPLVLRAARARAFASDCLRVYAKLYVGDERLPEQRV